MRFVVDLFRYIIIGLCAVVLVAVALTVMFVLDQGQPLTSTFSLGAIAVAIVVLAILVLNIGGIAILISIHDRHAELSDSADSIAASLERIADAASAGPNAIARPRP